MRANLVGRGAVLGLLLASWALAPIGRTAVPADAGSGDAPRAAASAPAAAVLAAVTGSILIERAGLAEPIVGALGMRLQGGDTVRVGASSSATLYMTGGGIVRVPANNRIEIPGTDAGLKAPPSQASKISRPTVEVFEAGLWVLNDPDGSILLSGMRGPEGQAWNDEGLGSDLLSPRYDTIAEARPAFHWSGQGTARVVVARGSETAWRSEPAPAGTFIYPESGTPLEPDQVYRWWLESAEGGAPLTEKVPFRMASRQMADSTTAFESDMAAVSAGPDGPAVSELMRCAYYLESGSWSRMLDAAARLRDLYPGSDLAERALTGARRQMRLDEEAAELLIDMRGKSRAPAAAAGRP